MPRDESNNPTERLARLLDAIAEYESYMAELEDCLARTLPAEQFLKLSRRPVAQAIADARAWYRVNGKRNLQTRRQMRRLRAHNQRQRQFAPKHTTYVLNAVEQSLKDQQSDQVFSPADVAERLREMELKDLEKAMTPTPDYTLEEMQRLASAGDEPLTLPKGQSLFDKD